MDVDRQEIRLKSGLHRSVSLRTGLLGERIVAKVFRSRGWWRRAGDGRRARREFRMLEALHAAGLAVPAPLGLRKTEAGWEVHETWIPDATDLLELSQPGACTPRAPERLARRLGALLGHAHALGLEHGDLHPGNLLVDSHDQVWLIDLASAHLRAALPASVVERDLTALNGDLRESCTRSLRRRFWVAWQRSFEAHGGVLDENLREVGARAEANGSTRRRDALLQHADRWTRESGLCERRTLASREVLGARHSLAREWMAAVDEQRIFEQDVTGLHGPLQVHAGHELWVDARAQHVQRDWVNLGRAWQHGLPCATPVFLLQGPQPRAAYSLPAGTLPLAESAELCTQLASALDRRGLRLEATRLWQAPDGAQLLAPGCRLAAAAGGAR